MADKYEKSVKYWSKVAKKNGVVLVTSLFEKRTNGLNHNTSVVFEKDGTIAGKYRKMHIPHDPSFYEKYYFTPGDLGFEPIKTSVGTLGVLICWDQWFPEAARIMSLKGADILIYPTAIGWFERDSKKEKNRQLQAWITIQKSHAIANGLPVVAVNRVGKEKSLEDILEDLGEVAEEIVLEVEEPEAVEAENELESEEAVEAVETEEVAEPAEEKEPKAAKEAVPDLEDVLGLDLEQAQEVKTVQEVEAAEKSEVAQEIKVDEELAETAEELSDINDIVANGEDEAVAEEIAVEAENELEIEEPLEVVEEVAEAENLQPVEEMPVVEEVSEADTQNDAVLTEDKNQFAELQGGFVAIKEAVVGLEAKVGDLRTDFENLEEKLGSGGATLSKEDRILEQFAALSERLQRIENQLGQNKVTADKEIEKQAELEKRLVALELEAQDRLHTKNLQENLQEYIEKRIPENVAKILRQEIALLQKQHGE